MKAAFDTSVIVAALVPAHPSHARAFVWLDAVAVGKLEGVVSAHAIAETYSVLTKLPLRPAITPTQAGAMVDRLRPILSVVSEDTAVVAAAVSRCASVGASTGAIFDAVHVVTAGRSSPPGLAASTRSRGRPGAPHRYFSNSATTNFGRPPPSSARLQNSGQCSAMSSHSAVCSGRRRAYPSLRLTWSAPCRPTWSLPCPGRQRRATCPLQPRSATLRRPNRRFAPF